MRIGVVLLVVSAIALIVSTAPSAQAPSVTIAVSGATVTLTPTTAQVTALQKVVADVNKSEGTMLTVNEWLRDLLTSRVQSAVDAYQASERTTACANYQAATAAVRTQVNAALGGHSPCN